jgi:hypothetical protein
MLSQRNPSVTADADRGDCRKTAARTAVIVLGMHRSGTSAITRVLGLCGGALPARSALDRHDSNPLGHWEPRLIVEAHERFLARSGVRWDDIFDYPSEIFGSEHADSVRERLTAIARREYGRADLFILKDPRLSRLLPLWRPVLERLDCEPRAVIAVRNPINVAASIRRRDGWDEYRALAVWTRYMLAAERDTRDMPRCFVRHEDLVDDWRSTIGKIAQRIDVPLDVESQAVAREVDAFVRDDLMHHRNADSDLFERSDIADCIKQVYRCCCAAADGEAMDTNVLDAVAEAFEHAAQVHRGRVPPALWREDRACPKFGATGWGATPSWRSRWPNSAVRAIRPSDRSNSWTPCCKPGPGALPDPSAGYPMSRATPAGGWPRG